MYTTVTTSLVSAAVKSLFARATSSGAVDDGKMMITGMCVCMCVCVLVCVCVCVCYHSLGFSLFSSLKSQLVVLRQTHTSF